MAAGHGAGAGQGGKRGFRKYSRAFLVCLPATNSGKLGRNAVRRQEVNSDGGDSEIVIPEGQFSVADLVRANPSCIGMTLDAFLEGAIRRGEIVCLRAYEGGRPHWLYQRKGSAAKRQGVTSEEGLGLIINVPEGYFTLDGFLKANPDCDRLTLRTFFAGAIVKGEVLAVNVEREWLYRWKAND